MKTVEWMGQSIPELWSRLQETDRTVVLYGMGNGADKILEVCGRYGISVREIFASDAFVRGQVFHGHTVLRWRDVKEKYGAENVTVLLAFASSLPEVLENIASIAAETELLVPDVPVFGNTLFDVDFFHAHQAELEEARALLSDEESRRIFDLILRYKLSGEPALLLAARNDPAEVMKTLVRPQSIVTAADLGAYTGDTVRELLEAGAAPKRIYAMEPDARNFRKLSEYAAGETRTEVIPVRAAAWQAETELIFDASGNRNASAEQNRSAVLTAPPRAKTVVIPALPPDAVVGDDKLDYIKYDVEGSEREALLGSRESILGSLPTLLVSVYHRSEDLFALPLLIRREFPAYRGFYLRRFGGLPTWDLNLYVTKEIIDG